MRNRSNVRVAVATALALASGYVSGPVLAQAAEGRLPDLSLNIEEITITAERREDTLQRSSLAISVVGADQLTTNGVTNPVELGSVVPGLSVSTAGGIVQTYVRGVGSFSSDARAEPSIAYNINGVYIGRPAGIGSIFFDLDRIEVLKGPQGTLYGRNASGGAINVITNKPTTRAFGANVVVEGGNYNDVSGSGYVNVPLGETFSMRLAGQATQRDGYLSDGYDDEDTQAGRLMALWEPSEAVSLLFTGEYMTIGGQGAGAVPRSSLRPTPSDPWTGPSDPRNPLPQSALLGGTRILNNGVTDSDIAAGSLELNWDLGFATLTALPAYRDADISYLTYTPGFLFNTAETSEQGSMELRLGNSDSQLKWVAGVFYFDEDQTEIYQVTAIPFQNTLQNSLLTTESYAAFGQATFSVSDTFRVIGGARYTDEEKTQAGLSTSLLPNGQINPNIPPTNNQGQVDFSNVSWKAGLEYDVAPASMLFLTVATGFKAGGLLPNIPAPANTFDEEEILAYTLGSRNRFFNNRLQVNVEGFYWDYDDKQERFLGLTNIGTVGLQTVNAGQATLYGVNLDVQFKLTEADEVQFGIEYLNSEYDQFSYNQVNSVDPAGLGTSALATSCLIGPTIPSPVQGAPTATTNLIDCSGKELIRAPELSGQLRYTHTFSIGSSWQLLAGVSSTFASSQFLSPDFIDSGSNDEYIMANADLTLRSRDGRWAISAYGRNLSEEAVYTGGFRYPFSLNQQIGGDPTLYYANIGAPRTYGVRLQAGF